MGKPVAVSFLEGDDDRGGDLGFLLDLLDAQALSFTAFLRTARFRSDP
jgi:hypothetical protein